MQDDEPKNNDQRSGGGENGFNWKGLILLSLAMGLFGLAIWSKSFSDSSKTLNYAEFKKIVESDRIHIDENATPPRLLRLVQKDGSSRQYVSGWYEVEKPVVSPDGKVEKPQESGNSKYKEFTVPVILEYVGDDLKTLLASKNLQIADLPTDSDSFGMVMMSFYLPPGKVP